MLPTEPRQPVVGKAATTRRRRGASASRGSRPRTPRAWVEPTRWPTPRAWPRRSIPRARATRGRPRSRSWTARTGAPRSPPRSSWPAPARADPALRGRQAARRDADGARGARPDRADGGGGAQVIRVGDAARPEKLRSTDVEGADQSELAQAIDRLQTAAAGAPTRAVVVASWSRPATRCPPPAGPRRPASRCCGHRDASRPRHKAAITAHRGLRSTCSARRR